MIRASIPADTPGLVELAHSTRVFKPLEIQALREVLDDYFAGNREAGHGCITHESNGQVDGFAYFAPTAMTDRTWELYWIAVAPAKHGSGIAGELLRHVEAEVLRRQGRMLFIDTSALPSYDRTRAFYLKHGYEIAGILRDWYADGDDKVIFRKRLR